MRGSGSAAGSQGGRAATERTVRWRDQSAVSRVVSAVTGRNTLVSGRVSVPSREQEPRQAEGTAEDAVSRRQESYLRDNAGMEYSLGRLSYLAMAEPGDEALAAMTTNSRLNSVSASNPDGAAIDLNSLPASLPSMVQSMQLPVEPGSVLSEALARSRAASAAVSLGGSQSDGENLMHDIDRWSDGESQLGDTDPGFDGASAIGSALSSFAEGR